MNKSESIELLTKSLIQFQGSIQAVGKNGENPFFKSKYATLDQIWNVIRKPLADAKLAISQFPSENGLTTILLHESGQYISVDTTMHKGSKPQEQGSSITYMRRYALSAVLGIVTEEDDDGNAASVSRKCAKCSRLDTKLINVGGKEYSVCPVHMPS